MASSSSTSEKLCRRFSLAEIQSATGGFSDKHVIGEGGFGKVYKGRIDNGSVTVAIKRLSKKQGKANDAKQGEKEFAAEMETLTKVRHHNLVSLIGYCDDEEEQTKQKEMILVYEYMANGTLADHLYKLSRSSDASSSLSWNQRLKICIGAGRGLDYLHSGCSIIHRDVKPTNILLDEHWTAKVADFGLAKQLSKDMLQSHVSTMIKGTFGYFDPSNTRASDTYAFGVILLEVLSEKPALGRNVVEDQLPMSIWAQEKIRSGKANQIVASDLKDQISEDCLKTFVGVAKKCLHQKPEKRLTMTRAVAQLELALEQQERKGKATHVLQFWPLWSRPGSRQKVQSRIDHIFNISVPTFPLAELEDIISPEYLIHPGKSLFCGVMKSGRRATIKMLSKELSEYTFIEEVSRLCSLKNDNIVQLVGYCLDGDMRVLVYETPRGSLYDILHGLNSGPVLSWAQRIKTAAGAANGLLYVHEQELIHRNISSNNVLLFDDDIAKITDGHLSTECCHFKEDYAVTRVMCTQCRSYHPREYFYSGHSQEGDVYRFGVLLLELLTGRKRFWDYSFDKENLKTWATQKLSKGELQTIVDARLGGDYPPKAVAKVVSVAGHCLAEDADHRPKMITVLKDLQFAHRMTLDYLMKQQPKK